MIFRIIIIWSFLCITIFSCTKDKNENDYCINNISGSPHRAILSDTELNTIASFFERNHIPYNNYQFYRLQSDELGYHHARCYQYINGLKLFTDDLIFHFDQNDIYSGISGDSIKKIDLDSKSNMIQNNVIDIYINEIDKDKEYPNSKDNITNGCFDIEFGYYDLNAGRSYVDNLFTKAWKVTPKGEDYPIAYVDDVKSKLIFYFNGIIINKK